MNNITAVCLYLLLGTVGGLLGARLKITGGVIIGAMLAVMIFKALAEKSPPVPHSFTLFVQILIGVLVGVSYTPEMGRVLAGNIMPIIGSTLALVIVGFLISLALVKFGVLEPSTAYLGTSPGAMTALISIAAESKANPAVVLAFHFFRIVFIIITAPVAFHLIRMWFPEAGGK